jgi:hypothetical protein
MLSTRSRAHTRSVGLCRLRRFAAAGIRAAFVLGCDRFRHFPARCIIHQNTGTRAVLHKHTFIHLRILAFSSTQRKCKALVLQTTRRRWQRRAVAAAAFARSFNTTRWWKSTAVRMSAAAQAAIAIPSS